MICDCNSVLQFSDGTPLSTTDFDAVVLRVVTDCIAQVLLVFFYFSVISLFVLLPQLLVLCTMII